MSEGYPGSSIALYRAMQSARACFYTWLFCISSEREIITKDIDRWTEIIGGELALLGTAKSRLVRLIVKYPEFRTLFCYRVAKERRFGIKLLLELAKRCYRPLESLYITTPSIGAGLFIQHGFSTIIAAKCLGENCWVNQQVTIGFSSADDWPTLGNSVAVKAGAIVIGDITIGDGAVVGAGAVVVKDVPPGAVVVGAAARIVGEGASKADAPSAGE